MGATIFYWVGGEIARTHVLARCPWRGRIHDHGDAPRQREIGLNGRARTRNGEPRADVPWPHEPSFRQILGYVHTESTFSSLCL